MWKKQKYSASWSVVSGHNILNGQYGADKSLIRLYKQALEILGFKIWFDEDAMPAGREKAG